jgi:hypothetical protein
MVVVRLFPCIGEADSRLLRSDNYVRLQNFARRYTFGRFRRFLRDVRREFMQRLYVAVHSTLGSYLRDALQEGSADAVGFFDVPHA